MGGWGIWAGPAACGGGWSGSGCLVETPPLPSINSSSPRREKKRNAIEGSPEPSIASAANSARRVFSRAASVRSGGPRGRRGGIRDEPRHVLLQLGERRLVQIHHVPRVVVLERDVVPQIPGQPLEMVDGVLRREERRRHIRVAGLHLNSQVR